MHTNNSRTKRRSELERRDRVVLENLPLVKAIAIRVHEGLPVHVDLDDLIHAGVLGLFDAAEKFNGQKGIAFSAYAKHRIKGAILDSLRQLDWASRDIRRRHKHYEAITRELTAELQRTPSDQEVADRLGLNVERWRQMMIDLRSTGLVSADTRADGSDEAPAPEYPGNPESRPDSMCARQEMKGVIGGAMRELPERYQKVVFLYYSREMSMKEIGDVLGVNESRVSQIHKSALARMAASLNANGIHSSHAF